MSDTESSSTESSLDSFSSSEVTSNSGTETEDHSDYSECSGRTKYETLVNGLRSDLNKLNDITDVDTLKGIIVELIKNDITDVDTLKGIIVELIKRGNEGGIKDSCERRSNTPDYDEDSDSYDSDDTVVCVPDMSSPMKEPKRSSKVSKKEHQKSFSYDRPAMSDDGTQGNSLASVGSVVSDTKAAVDDCECRKISLVPKSMSEIGKPAFLKEPARSSVSFFQLEPKILDSLINRDNQRGGVELFCGSMYSYMMKNFMTSGVNLPPKYRSALETAYAHHSCVISRFYECILHTFMYAYEISADLNSEDKVQAISIVDVLKRNASKVMELLLNLSGFYKEVLEECRSANWVKYPDDIFIKMGNVIKGIEENKIVPTACSWYDRYSGKAQRSQSENEHIIKCFKEQIMSSISRLWNMVSFFSLSVCRLLPSCGKFSTGAIYEAIAWGISFIALIKDISVKYDDVIKLLSETNSLTPPVLPDNTPEMIGYLRKSANVSKLTLYRELDIEPEIMKEKLYTYSEDGVPKRVSLNKLIAIATDPKAPEPIREKVADIVVRASFLLEKSHAAVLASLMDRFCVPKYFAEKHGKEHASEIRRRTVDLIKRWTRTQIDELDDSLLSILERFISSEVKAWSEIDAKSLDEFVYQYKFFRDRRTEIAVLPSIGGFDFYRTFYSFLDIFDGHGEKRIADQMTLASFNLFKKIRFKEFCYRTLGSDYYKYEFHDLERFTCHQDYVASLFGLYIASKNTEEEKERARKKVLEVMRFLRENNNFSDLSSLYVAYAYLFNDDNPDKSPIIKECKKIFDMKSYSKYKELYDKVPNPKVPFVVDFIKQADLTHEKDGLTPRGKKKLSQELQEVGQLNFEGIRKMCESIDAIRSARNGMYKISLVPSLYNIFYDPPRFIFSEVDFWKLKSGGKSQKG